MGALRPKAIGVWAVASVGVCLLILLAVSWAVTPANPSNPVSVVDSSVSAVMTAKQLVDGVPVAVPHPTEKPVTFVGIPPLTVIAVAPSSTLDTATLRTTGRVMIGDYTATALVGGDQRKIVVHVTHPPIGPVLAILLGLVLAWGVSSFALFYRRGALLRARLLDLWDDVDTHDAALGNIDGAGPVEFSIHAYAEQTLGTGRIVPRDSVQGAIDAGDLDRADKGLTDFRTFLDDYHGLLVQAGNLFVLYKAHIALFPDPHPALLVATERFVARPQPPAGDAGQGSGPVAIERANLSTVNDAIKTLAGLYPGLVTVRLHLTAYRARIEQLQATQSNSTHSWLDADSQSLAKAIDGWNGAHEDVQSALTADDLKNVASALATVGSALAALAVAYLPPMQLETEEAAAVMEMRRLLKESSIPAPRTRSPAERAAVLRHDVWVGDWVLLMVGMLVAAVTGVSVLYIGKAFGTPFDYVTAFLWGIGVDQTIRGLGGVLSKLGVPAALGITTSSGAASAGAAKA